MPLSRIKHKEKAGLFSYMFQGTALFDSMNVFQNIALSLEETTRMSKAAISKKVQDRLKQLDIENIAEKYPSQISGGMKKRVALARAMITDPEIILFDEPTTGLDPIRKNAVHNMIMDYQKKSGFTAVMVSHEIPDIFFISQRIAMLEQGKIIFEGSPDEFQNADIPIIHEFIRGLESKSESFSEIAAQSEGEKKFKEAMARLQRCDNPFSIILLTIENLDEIYSKSGNKAGHMALKYLAESARQEIRLTDTCSWHKMNKILIILADTNFDQAKQVCQKLISKMKAHDVATIKPTPDFCFAISAGIAEAYKDGSMEQIIAGAESAKNIVYEFHIC
jgi:phospholipid/cholesterol/gamma-HCH transport system ATP-binding protein